MTDEIKTPVEAIEEPKTEETVSEAAPEVTAEEPKAVEQKAEKPKAPRKPKGQGSEKAWEQFRELLESKETISVKIADVTKAGVTTMIHGVRGFIPASQLDRGFVAEEALPEWVGKTIEVRVITAEKSGRKLVLSAKEVLKQKEAEERREAAAAVQVGMITEGTVETIKDYGAFVNIGHGVTGLLHVSQISRKRIKTPGEVLKVGETVKVKVTKVENGKISLSIKALDESAPSEREDRPEREEREEIHYKLPKSENIGTGLADLLKGIKL